MTAKQAPEAIVSVTDAPIIPFTQYLLPHGHRRETTIEVSHEIARMAHGIIRRGLAFECEVLTTGEVSLTITDPENGDLAFQVVPNGPGVRDAVERLVSEFGQ
jgi:hypothetical protein